MRYLTICVRQRGERGTSLLLQQYLCRKIPVCFACLCTCKGENREEAGRYFTGQLLVWCHEFPWHKAVHSPERWLKRAEGELQAQIHRSTEEIRSNNMLAQNTGVSWRVLLGVGEEVLIMGDGQKCALLSMSMGRGAVTPMKGSFRGRLELGAGILMTTDDFFSCGEEKAAEALPLSELQTEEQAERHLRELMENEKETYGGGTAAILLAAKEDAYE